jgi:phage shock protein PspC (stress-responsive transcriptional regulator)
VLPRKVFRSRSDRLFLGTLAGIARAFAWDPGLVRLVFVFLTVIVFAWAPGAFAFWVLAYILSAWLIPLEPR